MEYKRLPRKTARAIPLVIGASLFVALMGAVVKFLSQQITTESLLFWRNTVSLIILYPFILRGAKGGRVAESLKTKEWKLQLVRGIASYFAVYFFFFSLKYLDLTDSVLLFNTIPIFIPIVALLWKRILIVHRLWWGIGTAFLGIIFVLNPTPSLFQPASLIALASGISGAISLVSLRLAHSSEPIERSMFYVFGIGAVIAGIWTFFTFEKSWGHLNTDIIALLVLMGFLSFCYQSCMSWAAHYAPFRLVSTFLYCGVIFSIILDTMIWKTPIEMSTMIGFALIVIGAVLKLLLYPEDDYKIKGK
ncbi:MAG: DMT family transporter [Parachlamydiales bacterium]|nr:DMT family transporter [Candidatus Acheromyda pituitae]